MKTLLVLRHAKSSWGDAALADIDRPLNERGKAASRFMGTVARERGLTPDLIVTSPAKRARKTAKRFRKAGAFEAEIREDERIYEASPNTLTYVAADTDDAVNVLLLVGHNPGMEGLVYALTGKEHPMPTAALAVIDLDIDFWKDIAAGKGTLNVLLLPRELMG